MVFSFLKGLGHLVDVVKVSQVEVMLKEIQVVAAIPDE